MISMAFSFNQFKLYNELAPKVQGKHVLLCCTGPSITSYKNHIHSLAAQKDVIVWGVNNAHPFINLDIHIWGEWPRWRKFRKNIRAESIFLFPPLRRFLKVIHEWSEPHKNRKVYLYKYAETPVSKGGLRFEDGCMYGCFANTGCISIYLSYLLRARQISVVGMDGYMTGNTFAHYSQELIVKKEEHSANDKLTAQFLCRAREINIPFKILTPTMFTESASKEWL